jgi:hypothetical protein
MVWHRVSTKWEMLGGLELDLETIVPRWFDWMQTCWLWFKNIDPGHPWA